MRNTTVNAIHEAARKNKNIVFITGDIGYSVIDNFQKELPEQCLNLGISEQNMMGVAAGLAMAGKKVFVYSIVPFVTARCMDQIKLDVCYHNLDVTVIGIGAGMAYGTHGNSHYGLEQLAQLKIFPNMKILVPADSREMGILLNEVINTPGPWFIHLNRGGEKDLPMESGAVSVGKGRVLKSGKDAVIFTIGNLAETALQSAEELKNQNLDIEVVHFHTLKPLDEELVKEAAKGKKIAFTLEEHLLDGGFGSSVADVFAKYSVAVPLHKFGVEKYLSVVGNQEFMRDQAGLSVPKIVEKIKSLCPKK